MILAGAAALLMYVFGAGDDQRPRQRPAPVAGGTITVRQQVIIRVPAGARRIRPAGQSMIRWRESRGPRCIPARHIVGYALLGQQSVDLIFRDHSRIRARLGRRCPALDFYRGFYLHATEDGQICADRDAIRSRGGAACEIDQFRSLRPAR